MSYDLVVEGDLDFVDLASAAQDLICADMFPIVGDGGPDAIGIAILSKRTTLDGARDQLRAFLATLEVMGATIHDLYTGSPIEHESDIDELLARVFE
jgi:hypothetical protein